MIKYSVRLFQNDTYEVMILDDGMVVESLFQGSLSDCEAYIRLKQNEEVDF